MSHLKERKEKNCLNCNAQLQGRFCQVCGQENVATRESFFHLVNHFFQDITHFDGKFFSSLRYLISRPGFLSMEYINGRRATYLNPVRMYVFTSGLFFLIFFTFFNPGNAIDFGKDNSTNKLLKQINSKIEVANIELKDLTDTNQKKAKQLQVKLLQQQIDSLKKDSFLLKGFKKQEPVFSFAADSIKSLAAYDSLQKKLPAPDRDGIFKKALIRKNLQLNKKYQHDSSGLMQTFLQKFIHSFPQIFFLSLPLFALLLQLLYFCSPQFYYVNHLLFTIHFFIFSFIAMLVIFSFNKLETVTGWVGFGAMASLVNLGLFYYLYKALRNFYTQKRAITIFKYLVLIILFLIVLLALFILFFFFSIFQL